MFRAGLGLRKFEVSGFRKCFGLRLISGSKFGVWPVYAMKE